jgi:general stress protein CsbA
VKAHIQFEGLLVLTILWLRIVLSYCVVGALLVALSSAYFQEINTALIISIMFVSLIIGINSAENTRRKGGLKQYQKELHQQKHLRY